MSLQWPLSWGCVAIMINETASLTLFYLYWGQGLTQLWIVVVVECSKFVNQPVYEQTPCHRYASYLSRKKSVVHSEISVWELNPAFVRQRFWLLGLISQAGTGRCTNRDIVYEYRLWVLSREASVCAFSSGRINRTCIRVICDAWSKQTYNFGGRTLTLMEKLEQRKK